MFRAVIQYLGVEGILDRLTGSRREALVDTSKLRGPGVHKADFLGGPGRSLEESYSLRGAQKLGEGSFGSVCLAAHKVTKRPAACKVIKREGVEDENLVRNEIALMQTLDHPKIVRLLECFEDSQSFVLALEHIPGGDLQQEVSASRGGIGVRRVAHYMRQVLLAVNYCHGLSLPIVHRDLKPGNVMKVSTASYPEVKVIDYGMATAARDGPGSGSLCGTPAFMAPEAFAGECTEAVDLWAVGVMTYYLLVKDLPIGKADPKDMNAFKLLVQRIQPGYFPGVQGWDRSGLRTAKELLSRLLRQEPCERPSAGQALASSFVRGNASPPGYGFLRGPSYKLVKGLKGYPAAPTVLRACLLAAASRMEHGKMPKMRRHFEILDRDCDGHLSAEDLAGLLPDVDRSLVVRAADLSADGLINFTEFAAAWLYGRLARDQSCLRFAFDVLDADGDGRVSRQDVFRLVEKVASLQEVESAFPEATSPMRYEEFAAQLTRGLPAARPAFACLPCRGRGRPPGERPGKPPGERPGQRCPEAQAGRV